MKTGIIHKHLRIIQATKKENNSKNNVLQSQTNQLCTSDVSVENNNFAPMDKKFKSGSTNKVVSFTWSKKVTRPISGSEVLSGINTDVEELNLNQATAKSASGSEKQLEKERRSRTESDKTKLSTVEEDSFESMKDKIACFVSYLESDTDSHSDTELSQLRAAKCENKRSDQGNKSDEENETKTSRLMKGNLDLKKSKESNEGTHFFEKTFQQFTTKWDMKTCPLREGVIAEYSHAPVTNTFSKDYDVTKSTICSNGTPHLHKATTRLNANENNTLSIDNLDEDNDKEVSSLPLNALTPESIGRCVENNTLIEENSFLPFIMKQGDWKSTAFSACEVLAAVQDKRSDGSKAESSLNVNQLKESREHSSPGGHKCSEKTSKEEYGDSKQREMHRIDGSDVEKRPFLLTTNIGTSHVNKCESLSVEKKINTRVESKNSNRIRPVNDLTTGQSYKGDVDNECTTLVKKSSLPASSKNPTVKGRKVFCNECETDSSCEHDETAGILSLEPKSKSIINSSTTHENRKDKPELKYFKQDYKKDRKRSRSISSEKDRRSRSLSSEHRKSKGSPIRNRRIRRKYQNPQGRRKMASHSKNCSSFRSSWMDNIVVKIADPPRPARKRRNAPSCEKSDFLGQRRRNRSPEVRNEPSHIRERSTRDEHRDERAVKRRRWTYDDYERTSDGRLRRKSSYALERAETEENHHWKRYDDESTMPYQGYADSQVQSLLRQLCQNYITQLYPSKSAENRVKSKSPQVISGGNKLKPHRSWYMSLKDWVSYDGETCKKEGLGKASKTQKAVKNSATNKKQQKSAPKQQSLISDDTKDRDISAITDGESNEIQSKKIIYKNSNICSDDKNDISTNQDTAKTLTKDQKIETKEPKNAPKNTSSTNDNHATMAIDEISVAGQASNLEDDSGSFIKQKPFDKNAKQETTSKTLANTSEQNSQLIKTDKHLMQSDLTEEAEKQKKSVEEDKQIRSTHSKPAKTNGGIGNEDLDNLSNTESVLTHNLHSTKDRGSFEKFASDTFAICNLSKNVTSSFGNMKNDLIVTLTPSSYLYTENNIKEKPVAHASYSQNADSQGIFVPTSSSFAKTTNISCNTLCFHFDFDYYDTALTDSTAMVPGSSVSGLGSGTDIDCAQSFDSKMNGDKAVNDVTIEELEKVEAPLQAIVHQTSNIADILHTSQDTESSGTKDNNSILPLSSHSQDPSDKNESITESKELNNLPQLDRGSFRCHSVAETSTKSHSQDPSDKNESITESKELNNPPELDRGSFRCNSETSTKSATSNTNEKTSSSCEPEILVHKDLLTHHIGSYSQQSPSAEKSQLNSESDTAKIQSTDTNNNSTTLEIPLAASEHDPSSGTVSTVSNSVINTALTRETHLTRGGDVGVAAVIKPIIQTNEKSVTDELKWPRIEKVQSTQPLVNVHNRHDAHSDNYEIHFDATSDESRTYKLQPQGNTRDWGENYSSVPNSFTFDPSHSQHSTGYFNQPAMNYRQDISPPSNQGSRFITTFSNYTRVVINRSLNEQGVPFVPQDDQQCLPNPQFTQLQPDFTNQQVNQINSAAQSIPLQRFTPLQQAESSNQQVIQTNCDTYQRFTPLQLESSNQEVNPYMQSFLHQRFTPFRPELTNQQLIQMDSYQRCVPSQESNNHQGKVDALPYPYLTTPESSPWDSHVEGAQFERRQQHEVQINSFVNNGKQFYQPKEFSTQHFQTMKHISQQQQPYRHYKLHEPQQIQNQLQQQKQQQQQQQQQQQYHLQQQQQQQLQQHQLQVQQHHQQQLQQHQQQQMIQHHNLQDQQQRFHKDLSQFHHENYQNSDTSKTQYGLQLQQNKQHVQQQQILGSSGQNRSSEEWHSEFLQSIPNKTRDMSQIPWGQHALDRQHQINILSTNSQRMPINPLYDKR